MTRGRLIWLAVGAAGLLGLPATMRFARETGFARDWAQSEQTALVLGIVSLAIPSTLAIAYGLGFLSNESLASRRGDSETRDLSVGTFIAAFSGSLAFCIGLASYLEKSLELPQGAATSFTTGLLFLVAATGHPWWLYGTIRRLGWFSIISRDRLMRLVLGGLGSAVVAGSILSSGITWDNFWSWKYLNRSLEAADAGDLPLARQLMERAVEQDASYPDARHFLGAICSELRDYDCAVAQAARAVELDPEVPMYRFAYGTALLGNARYEEARTEFRSAVVLDPSFERAWLSRARLAHMLGDLAEADSAYSVLQHLSPDILANSPEDQAMWGSARAGIN